ncbi:DUF3240 family protein [Dechloromonas sp. ZY10]|uniref:DUF3240 family protein n=1 Tax=Dechloromonas aquae TaxID=2664436 RepID=UPI003529CE17
MHTPSAAHALPSGLPPGDELLLTLIVPVDVAEAVEDLLLARSDLVSGFTSSIADGHGSRLALHGAAELVSGHSPRSQIQTIATADDLRLLLAALKAALPRAQIYYWLTPVLEKGRL